jgi:hypothetical protein
VRMTEPGREIRSAYRISVATSVGRDHMYVVPSIIWCHIIKTDISGIICIGVEWRDFVNSVMNQHEEEEFIDYI